MASSKEFLYFVLEQLSPLQNITYRAMMDEYILYYHGKIIGGIYDNRFLIKQTKSAKELIPNTIMEIPYPGAKPMIMIENIENQEFLIHLLNTIYPELPKPKRLLSKSKPHSI